MRTSPPVSSPLVSRGIRGLLAATTLVLVAVCTRAPAAAAESVEKPRPTRFQALDTNGDGWISLSEYLASRPSERGPRGDLAEERFRELDVDRDGYLSESEFLNRNPNGWAWWLGGLSLVTFLGSLIAVPLVVARLPEDYFIRDHRPADWFKSPRTRIEWLILKNVLGLLLLASGIAMLVLPGQGLLTIILGLMLMDFPGKSALLHRFALRPNVLRTINWMRRQSGRPPMLTLPNSRV